NSRNQGGPGRPLASPRADEWPPSARHFRIEQEEDVERESLRRRQMVKVFVELPPTLTLCAPEHAAGQRCPGTGRAAVIYATILARLRGSASRTFIISAADRK